MIKYNVIFNQIFNFLLKKIQLKFLFCNLLKNSVELLQVCYIRMIPRKYRYIFWLYNNHDNKFKQQCLFCIGGIDVTENYCSIQYFTVLYYECSRILDTVDLTFYITSWRYQPIVKIFILPNLGVDHSL